MISRFLKMQISSDLSVRDSISPDDNEQGEAREFSEIHDTAILNLLHAYRDRK